MTEVRIATFAAGCFWNVEDVFRRRRGVLNTAVGFSGGALENPEYRDVASGRTGHAEVVRVQYDPVQVRYEELLELFWSCHDPSEKRKPPGQVGSQYRSIIFVHDTEQELAAKAGFKDYNFSAMEGFLSAKVAVEGLRRAGRNLTREGYIAALEKMQDVDLGGFFISYSPTNRAGSKFVDLTIIGRDGKFLR